MNFLLKTIWRCDTLAMLADHPAKQAGWLSTHTFGSVGIRSLKLLVRQAHDYGISTCLIGPGSLAGTRDQAVSRIFPDLISVEAEARKGFDALDERTYKTGPNPIGRFSS